MSTTQILVLGAHRRLHDLPRPADRADAERRARALKALLSAIATGILLFLLWDVLVARRRAGRGGARRRRTDDGGSWVDFVRLAVTFAAGFVVGLMSLVYYDRWIAPPAQQGDRSARVPRPLPSSTAPGSAGLSPARVARAPDRDRHRAAQLLRGPRDRAVRGARTSHARARPDHRLRPAQRDRGLRHRRAAVGRRVAAVAGVPRAAGPDRRRADLLGTLLGQAWVNETRVGRVPRARRRLDPLRRDRADEREPAARGQDARHLGAPRGLFLGFATDFIIEAAGV